MTKPDLTDRDLEAMKDLPVPAPRAGAKAAALSAAFDAFDADQQKNKKVPQDRAPTRRPTHVTSNPSRRRIMRSITYPYAIAASIAAMAISLPVVLHYIQGPATQYAPASSEFRETARNQPRPADLDDAKAKPVTAKPFVDGQPAEKDARDKQIAGLDTVRPTAEKTTRKLSQISPSPTTQLTKKDRLLRQKLAAARRSPGQSANLGPSFRFKGGGRIDGKLASAIERPGRIARAPDTMPPMPNVQNRDRFEHVASNPVKQVSEHPVSTFSVDVDTASYAVLRRALNSGRLPPKDAVRVEEMINYFTYNYARPEQATEPFKPSISVVGTPWNPETRLVHIGIKGYELNSDERPRANLVLLIDVSGSMGPTARLPLLKNAFKMLLDKLKPDDTVGIVTYASGSGIALEPTKISDKGKIIAAIDRLGAGGSTAGAQGIQDAYRLAAAGFDKKAVNRVIIGTDGDFNVGITDQQQLKGFIERKRQSGIYLSILGVGRGNYNDALMQTLAQNGNGTAAYIDTLNEARKVLVEEASSTLFPIAKDVKIQIEFNPAQVREYRLIGYETRALRREDFNNDKVDAGDVGSGHAVTAIYEITPVGAKKQLVDGLRYGARATAKRTVVPPVDGKNGELGFFKLRYKLPNAETSRLMTMPIRMTDDAPASVGTGKTSSPGSSDVRFATAVAAFGQLLKGEPWMKDFGYDDVIALANAAKGDDPFGLRAEFVNLVRLAKSARP